MENKKNGVFTGMAIYIDKHVYEKNHDSALIYDYLCKLVKMLSHQKKFFKKAEDYDGFAHYVATWVYLRMVNPKQFLPADDPQYLPPIISCLNYLKAIISGRKCRYMQDEYQQVTAEDDDEAYNVVKGYLQPQLNYSKFGLLKIEVLSYISQLDKTLYSLIKNGVYGKDKTLSYKIYTNALLEISKMVSLPNKMVNNIKNNNPYKYVALLERVLERESGSEICLYDLDDKYSDYVYYIVNRFKSKVIEEINSLKTNYDFSEEMVSDILLSGQQELEDE